MIKKIIEYHLGDIFERTFSDGSKTRAVVISVNENNGTADALYFVSKNSKDKEIIWEDWRGITIAPDDADSVRSINREDLSEEEEICYMVSAKIIEYMSNHHLLPK